MHIGIQRRTVLRAGLVAGASLWIPTARAHEIITSVLRVIHPWSRSTPPDATFAVLCMRFDDVVEADRLILVESPVATGAVMAGRGAAPAVDFLIPQGQETFLSDDDAGTCVHLTGLKFPLQIGRSYPLVLGFEKGGIYNTTFGIDQLHFQ